MNDTTLTSRPGNLGDALVERLKSAIQQGLYAPGQRLIEADLMVDLGAGRGPVREALRRLGSVGIVQLIPNRGAFVARFSDKDLFDLFRVREGLEGWAARLAAERVRSGSEREAFAAALDRGRRPEIADPVRRFREENRILHDLVIATADNAFLAEAIDRLKVPAARLHLQAANHDDYRDESAREHETIVQAVLRGDPDAAEAAMRQHLSRARARIFEQRAGGHDRQLPTG